MAIGKPKRAPLGGDAQVAAGGDGGAAAGAGAGDGGDGGDAAGFEDGEDAVDALLVADGVGGGFELAELADIGAGGERFLAGAGDDEGAEGGVGVGALDGGDQAVVHGPGQGVALGRAVEGDPADAVGRLPEQFFGHACSLSFCRILRQSTMAA